MSDVEKLEKAAQLLFEVQENLHTERVLCDHCGRGHPSDDDKYMWQKSHEMLSAAESRIKTVRNWLKKKGQ